MLVRLIAPALLAALAGIASAQNTAPAETPAEPAVAAPDAAAAASAASAPAKTAAAPQQRCHKELPIGSTIPKTVCETTMPSDLDQMRQRALDDLKHTVTPGVRGVGGG